MGLEPVSQLESWNEKNLEVALWCLPAPRSLKVAAVNNFATFALNGVDNQVMIDAKGQKLRSGPIKAGRFHLMQGPSELEKQFCSRAPVEMLTIYFSTRLMHQVASALGCRRRSLVIHDPMWDVADGLLERLASSIVEDLRSTAIADRMFAQETAMLILHRLLLKHSSLTNEQGVTNLKKSRDYRWAVEFMSDNIDKSISVDQLAALVNMTTFSFIRGFTKIYGATPMRFLRQMRQERAKEMLVRTSLPIAAVSHRLGFSDAAHFITAFKRGTGLTPRAYRLASTRSASRPN